MSKVAVSRYELQMAAERRARQKKMEEVRQMLVRTEALRKKLVKLGELGGEDLGQTLRRYQDATRTKDWGAVVADCDRLHSELPVRQRQLADAIVTANERRMRLGLTAATLGASTADRAEQKALAKIARDVARSNASELDGLARELKSIMTRRLERVSSKDQQLTALQLELARTLMPSLPSTESVRTIRDQISAGKGRVRTFDAVSRIEALVTQLASAEEDVGDLLDRARTLIAETDVGRRNMQIDSLMIEAAERLKTYRQGRELDTLSGGALAHLAPFDGEECECLRQGILSAREKADRPLLQNLSKEAALFARTDAARRDSVAARSAVLSGLRDLGYEIRMDGDVWQESTRITAGRPEEPNYDIELSAVPNGKIQSKVRAYDHSGRSSGVNRRDIEVEQSWCDDLRLLHSKLSAKGIAATIDDEKKPGSVVQNPLPARAPGRDRKAPPATRTLK